MTERIKQTLRKISETAKVLIKAKALIEDEKNWWDGKGGELGANGRLCAQLALAKAEGHDRCSPAFTALTRAAQERFGMDWPRYVNDQIGHTAVMQMFDLAISTELNRREKDNG